MRCHAEGNLRFNSQFVRGTVEVLNTRKIIGFKDRHGRTWSLKCFSMVYVYSNAEGSHDNKWDNDEVWAYPIKDRAMSP